MKTTQVSILRLLILLASAMFGKLKPSRNIGHNNMCTDIVAHNDTTFIKLKASANATIKYIQTHVAEINKKPICFYSGFTYIDFQQVYAWQKISDFKKKHGIHCHILHDIIHDANQTYTDWQDEDWTQVSKTLAENAHDPIFILLGQMIFAKSIYLNVELPTLINNNYIMKPLIIYGIEADGSFVPINKAYNIHSFAAAVDAGPSEIVFKLPRFSLT